ncbi:protein EARLY FLOWERING 4-like isoform X2 [Cynara cardunculus var. scolymus]|uniref:protein EARLY FLOWERING 4-like isoform X2 n=1 Tax=Cynara cardunculus var. scolymus TaxID=59895 RepID=UPI000D6313D4|nr:protein EARLY FLOWERING 4-like isoform X2 [Cynara cardunculus var. scolymus]
MDSSSAVEEANYQEKPKNSGDQTTVKRWLTGAEKDEGEEECDAEAWETLSKSFKEVQSVLDQNRLLIQQVNENHQSKIPDNMVKNVALIQEINGNISKAAGTWTIDRDLGTH